MAGQTDFPAQRNAGIMEASNIWTGIMAKYSGRGFIRGGNWNNGSNDGVETLNLNNTPGNTNNNIGFRCSRYSSIKTIHFGPNRISTDSSLRRMTVVRSSRPDVRLMEA